MANNIGFLPGFTKANGTVKRRIILSVEALEGAGKTRFTLTAPGPIAFLNFDLMARRGRGSVP